MAFYSGDSWGIDFGTTNSTLAAYIGGKYGSREPALVTFDDAGRPVPSVVAICKESGLVHVGRDAKKCHLSEPEKYEYVRSVKTILEDDAWHKNVAGKDWRAIDVAAEIFKKVKDIAERQSYILKDAVVAVPNAASGKKRDRIMEAARIAGIRIIQFVTEPVAAFFANYRTLQDERYVAVFDWGGGTLDITILENRADGKIVELAKEGMQLAGDDIDKAIAQDIHRRRCERHGLDRSFSEMPLLAQEMLVEECERAKCELRDKTETKISLVDYGGKSVLEVFNQDNLSVVARPFVKKALDCLAKAIETSKLSRDDLGKILVVGGSCKLRSVVEGLRRMFPDREDIVVLPKDAEWNVAKGSARIDLKKGQWLSAEDIGIILGDEGRSFYSLLDGYFHASPSSLNHFHVASGFGIMDTSQHPRIVFAARDGDGKERILDASVVANAYGFLDEKIELHALVDDSLVFRVKIKSNRTAEKDAIVWEYPDMRLVYEAPQIYHGGRE